MAAETLVLDDDCVPLTGAGGTAPALARLARPRSAAEAAAALRGRGARGAVARGLGRSGGDAAQSAGGTVLDMTALDRVRAVDPAAGLVVCEAGAGLRRLARTLLPLGWCPPVLPADGDATVGGAVATALHGTGHPATGTFARHVTALELLTPDGEIRTVRPGEPLFDATAGGLGLTGVILTVAFRPLPVATAWLTTRTERAGDLDALLARWTGDGTGAHPWASARIDLLARGAATGRAVLTRAAPAPYEALPRTHRARRDPLALPRGGAPLPLPRGAAQLLAEVRARSAPRGPVTALRPLPVAAEPPPPSRSPLPSPYGPRRFVRHRCVLPEGREEELRGIVARLADRRSPARAARHALLVRLGAQDPGPLSFPLPGWCLTLDVPLGAPGLARFLDALDERVAAAGGRVCLAEDARLRPELVAAMYPGLGAFRELRAALDPRSALRSDLARRLGL